MNTSNWAKFRRIETIILSILLYSILLLYVYQFSKIANKPRSMEQDEIFYYMEAKAISAHNIYNTPISYDGFTSTIGNFGAHGICYPIKDGWLAKIFFQSQDPPMVWNNFLITMITMSLILLFKAFSLNTRLKIALTVATNNILYTSTLSYMQEPIHFLLALLALRLLYLLYHPSAPTMASQKQVSNSRLNQLLWIIRRSIPNGNCRVGSFTSSYHPIRGSHERHLALYLILIILAITFRYSWFIWGLGILPLATNFKNFKKWTLIFIGLLTFGILINNFFVAPWPYVYEGGDASTFISGEKSTILDSLITIWQKFTQHLKLFFTPDQIPANTFMRYLFLAMLIINTWFAIVKRSRFTIACTLIAWAYLFACLAFYLLVAANDLRILSSINLLLTFSLIGTCNSYIFYPIIAVQLLLFPAVIERRNNELISLTCVDSPEVQNSRKSSFSKIKELVTDIDADNDVVIVLPIQFVYFMSYYFVNFPLINDKDIPIHYSVIIAGQGFSKTHPPNYVFASQLIDDSNYKLIYSDKWMILYQILNNKLPISKY